MPCPRAMLHTSYRRMPDKSWAAPTGSSPLSLFLLVHPQLSYINKGEYDGVNYWDEIRVHVEGRFSLGPEDAKAYLASS